MTNDTTIQAASGRHALRTATIITLALTLAALGVLTATVIDATATIPWWQPTAGQTLKGATP